MQQSSMEIPAVAALACCTEASKEWFVYALIDRPN